MRMRAGHHFMPDYIWHWLFLAHPHATPRPQSYRAHFRVAFGTSMRLMLAGLVGVLHAIVPAFAPFYTSTRVIRVYNELHMSGRHDDEIKREWKERSHAS